MNVSGLQLSANLSVRVRRAVDVDVQIPGLEACELRVRKLGVRRNRISVAFLFEREDHRPTLAGRRLVDMTKLIKFVKDLVSMEQILQASDEAYLAGAADTFELERRMPRFNGSKICNSVAASIGGPRFTTSMQTSASSPLTAIRTASSCAP